MSLTQAYLEICGARKTKLFMWLALKTRSKPERMAAITALGYAYVGTAKEEVSALLVPILVDLETLGGLEVSAAAALALGLVYVGTGDENIAEAIFQTLVERVQLPAGIDTIQALNLALGFALLFLEQKQAIQTALAGLEVVSHHPLGIFTKMKIC